MREVSDRLRRLAATFPSLHGLLHGRLGPGWSLEDVRGIYCNASYSYGTREAARFVLHVALRFPFSQVSRANAWASWDRAQRAAFSAWEADPWYEFEVTPADLAVLRHYAGLTPLGSPDPDAAISEFLLSKGLLIRSGTSFEPSSAGDDVLERAGGT